jgi:hypothetical protein
MAQAKQPVKRTYQAVLDWQDESRRAFGKMLLNWRRRNGWTQYTACEWGTEAKFEVISYGNLSVIEQGKAGELRQKAFFQLEELNRRLAEKDLGSVTTQRLKDQLKDAEPLRGDDGKLWDAVDFWKCYIGYEPVPKLYQVTSAPAMTPKQSEEVCRSMRKRVRQVIKEGEYDVSQAIEELIAKAPQEHQKRFREVLGVDDYTPAELSQLWAPDADGQEYQPWRWIDLWNCEHPPVEYQ